MVSVCASLLNKKKKLHLKKSKSHAAVANSSLARSVGHSEAGVLICVLPGVRTAVHTNHHCTRPRELGRVGFPNPEEKEKQTGENKSAPSAAFLPSFAAESWSVCASGRDAWLESLQCASRLEEK